MCLAFVFGYWVALRDLGAPVGHHLKETVKRIDRTLFGGYIVPAVYREHIPDSIAPRQADAYQWTKQGGPFLAIAHGLGPQLYGGANGHLALERAYGLGFRVFEVDLVLTSDGRLICFHGADEQDVVDAETYQEFARSSKERGLEPMEFSDVLAWMRQHPETYFILDVKNRFYDAYRLMHAGIQDGTLARRIIPQAYSFEELAWLRQGGFAGFFAGELFTSYRSRLSTSKILRAAERFHLPVVTLSVDRVQDLKELPADVLVLTHPVEDAFQAASLRARGVDGIYTSYLAPETVPELYARWGRDCLPGENWRKCDYLSAPGRAVSGIR